MSDVYLLGDELLTSVDKLAAAYGWSRVVTVRHLIAMGIDAERKARVPGGNPDIAGAYQRGFDDGFNSAMTTGISSDE